MTMPQQHPGTSKQDYQTPPVFLEKLKQKLGINQFSIDLAASLENSVASFCYTEEDNSLVQSWDRGGWGFCNPPFAKIRPWVHKAFVESVLGAKVAMLVPASTGSNWWRDYVDGIAYVLFLNGRLTFVGETKPYVKDCAVLLYAPMTLDNGGYAVWNWR